MPVSAFTTFEFVQREVLTTILQTFTTRSRITLKLRPLQQTNAGFATYAIANVMLKERYPEAPRALQDSSSRYPRRPCPSSCAHVLLRVCRSPGFQLCDPVYLTTRKWLGSFTSLRRRHRDVFPNVHSEDSGHFTLPACLLHLNRTINHSLSYDGR